MVETARPRLRQRLRVGEVGVVPGGLAGERDVHGVMPVVDPLRAEAVSAGAARQDHDRVVEVALGDEAQRSPELGAERIGALGDLLQDVRGAPRRLMQGVHGVEPQTVDVVVAQPHQGVVRDVVAHGPLVEVDARAPRGVLPVAQVRTVLGQVVAGGAEVVVHDVLDHGDAGRVRGIHEAPVGLRPAVILLHGVPEHAVVAPVVRTVEAVDGEELHVGHPELDEVRQLADRGVERALGGERAEVQLVDQSGCQVAPGPLAVGPGERRAVVPRRELVHAAGLAPRARIGPRRLRVPQHEAVLVAAFESHVDAPPPGIPRRQLDVVVPRPPQSHSRRARRPHLDTHVSILPGRAVPRAGRVRAGQLSPRNGPPDASNSAAAAARRSGSAT